MRLFSLLAIGLVGICGCTHTGVESLLCEPSGMAGVTFGQKIEQDLAPVIEVADSGVTYFNLEPVVEIQPFERLIVGVSPNSRQVFSIQLETHGDEMELDRIIKARKEALEKSHASLSWRVIANHHYGDGLDDLDVALYRIGDFVKGEPTYLLSYDCDNKVYRKIVFDEARDAIYGR